MPHLTRPLLRVAFVAELIGWIFIALYLIAVVYFFIAWFDSRMWFVWRLFLALLGLFILFACSFIVCARLLSSGRLSAYTALLTLNLLACFGRIVSLFYATDQFSFVPGVILFIP